MGFFFLWDNYRLHLQNWKQLATGQFPAVVPTWPTKTHFGSTLCPCNAVHIEGKETCALVQKCSTSEHPQVLLVLTEGLSMVSQRVRT